MFHIVHYRQNQEAQFSMWKAQGYLFFVFIIISNCNTSHLFNELVSSIFNILYPLSVNFQISFECFMLLQKTLVNNGNTT